MHLFHILFLKVNFIAKYVTVRCSSTENPEGLCASSDVSERCLDVLNLWPCHPTNHSCSYRISKTDEEMTIKYWKKCMVNRRELLGSNIRRSARIGDMIISILHNGESGPILFYAILPKRR